MGQHGSYDASYLLRLSSADKRLFEKQAKKAGVSLADAMREGTRQYLAARVTPTKDDDLLAEFKAVASRVEARFQGGPHG